MVAVPACQHWLVRLAICLLVCSAPIPGAARTPDQASGVFGLVPNYVEDFQRLEKQIALTRRQLDHLSTHAPRGMADSLKRNEALRDSMKNRCAEAFDPDSRLSAMYSIRPGADAGSFDGRETCVDSERFPRGFMKMVAAAACNDDGSFRLALPVGRYAVFAGQSRVGTSVRRASGSNARGQFVDVKPHQWLRAVPVAGEPEPRLTAAPAYDSGIKGHGLSQSARCYGNPPARRAPTEEKQCVEAYSAGGAAMVACAACRFPDGDFVMPLPPGQYFVEFDDEKARASDSPAHFHPVTVSPRQWLRLDARDASGGAPLRCPPLT